ncbi:MAG: DUF1634 domain-containing protein [Bdellovibrionales bacterium]|jgi:uncharacterized membrane protein|nr:DUF1634 domain-containing protein [Bdellovibrionales bacterium]
MKQNGSIEVATAKVLKFGVLIAGALLLLGWLTQIRFSENVFLSFQSYDSSNFVGSLQEAWSSGQWGVLVSYLGLAVLISLPMVRVIMTGRVFLRDKEYLMVASVALVVIGLILGVSLGFGFDH